MPLVLRNVKQAKLTWAELDGNFTYLEDKIDAVAAAAGGAEIVRVTPQDFLPAQQNQARANLLAAAAEDVVDLQDRVEFLESVDPVLYSAQSPTPTQKQTARDNIEALGVAEKGANNGVATLDGSGKIPTNQLPPLAIKETFVVGSQAAMLALTAQQGDAAVRTDISKTFFLVQEPATLLSNWQEVLTPTDGVTSVGLSAPLGFTVSNTPITSTGVLGLGFTAGYSLPTNVKQLEWDNKANTNGNYPNMTVGNATKLNNLSDTDFVKKDGSVAMTAPLTTQPATANNQAVTLGQVNGLLDDIDLQQVTNNGSDTTLRITAGGFESYQANIRIVGNSVITNQTKLILENQNSTELWALSHGVNNLSEENFSIGNLDNSNNFDWKLIINNAGLITSKTHGTSADWNAKVSQSQLGNYVNKAGDTMSGSLNFPSNTRIIFGSSLNFGIMYDPTYGGINFYRSGFADGVIFLKDNDNVGIGTPYPQAKLHVNGNAIVSDATAPNHAVAFGQLANYALLSQVYTQSQALALFVGLNGVQTIADTKTFTSSPIVPTGTLAGHSVNLGQVTTLLNDKVDKVPGKQLSTEDYTSAEKTKLNNIQAGAEVNVNADWNATSGDAQILNKPTIPVIPNNLVTTNTPQTISATKDFTVSPVVPYASDSEHPVPFLQMQEYISNRFDAISSYSRNVINTNSSTIGVKEWIKTIVFATNATGTIINPEETLKNGAILNICAQAITAGSINVNLPVRRLDGSNVSVYSFAQRKSYIFYYNDSYNRWDETHAINNS